MTDNDTKHLAAISVAFNAIGADAERRAAGGLDLDDPAPAPMPTRRDAELAAFAKVAATMKPSQMRDATCTEH